jgi:hypothetical protein
VPRAEDTFDGSDQVRPYFIAAGSDGWSQASYQVAGSALKHRLERCQGVADHASDTATPSHVSQGNHLVQRVIQEEGQAVRETEEERSSRLLCDQTIGQWDEPVSLRAAHNGYVAAVHLMRRDDLLPAEAQHSEDCREVGFYCSRLIAHRVPHIQAVERTLARSTDTREDGVQHCGVLRQPLELIEDNAVTFSSDHVPNLAQC